MLQSNNRNNSSLSKLHRYWLPTQGTLHERRWVCAPSDTCLCIYIVFPNRYALLRLAIDPSIIPNVDHIDRCSASSCFVIFKCSGNCKAVTQPPPISNVTVFDLFNLTNWQEASSQDYDPDQPLVKCADPAQRGFMCQKCAAGFWRFNGCAVCPSMFVNFPLLTVLLWLTLTFYFFEGIRASARVVPKLLIIIPFLQILVVLSKLELKWKWWANLFAAFSVFNFNYKLTLHECNISMSFDVEWVMYISLPFMWLALQMIQYICIDVASRVAAASGFNLPPWIWRRLLDRSNMQAARHKWKASIIDGLMFTLKATWIPATVCACMRP